jgi:hypothetical protein
VLLRRTRLGLLAARDLLDASGKPTEAVHRAAKTLGAELGWDDARVGREIEGFAVEAADEGILVDPSVDTRP